MNAKLITVFCIALLTVTGCAATPSPEPTASSVTTMSKAQRYQASVQAQANFRGVEVHWVNLPDENDLAKYKDPVEAEIPANEMR